MLVRVAVAGVPNSANRATWPFPTAGLVGYEPVSGMATFEIPDTDAPPNMPAPGSASMPNTPVGPVQIALSGADLAAWKAAMSAKYPTWGAAFGPQVK